MSVLLAKCKLLQGGKPGAWTKHLSHVDALHPGVEVSAQPVWLTGSSVLHQAS